jgi:hypothetical protein
MLSGGQAQLNKNTSDTACKFNQYVIDFSCSALLMTVHQL